MEEEKGGRGGEGGRERREGRKDNEITPNTVHVVVCFPYLVAG